MQKKIRVTPKKGKIMPANSKTTFFPVVGIGGSAGGLEAFQELLKNLSDKPGMAFVFIMHLAPGHKSMLTELLARLTKMPVREIKNGMLLEVNHVYIIPPGTNISIASEKLILIRMKDAGLKRMPIDWFFHSLAEERGNRAIGVILSGTATDGTLGAEAIKAEGGIVFAQDEKSAKYDGMPQSAIAAGCVDFVLSPKKIASELERIAKHPLISSAELVDIDKPIITEYEGMGSIFDILRSAKGLDFTHYKTPTISRRVSRRMVLLKLENFKDYIKFLRENKDEVEKLYEDLLINVTSFFRDSKVFDTLKKQVLPAILKNKTKDQEVRIWVPGCSSGEEAYSIAICILETLGNKAGAVPVQIFATDISENGITKARQGIYGKNIKNSIAPERLKRFFTKEDNSYKVSKRLREMCIFSKQNVFSDPPFSNLDLISCRNLLIYLQPVLQKKVFHNFHYALRPGGFLLLGNSEAAGGYSNLFKTLDGKHRIFVKKYLSVGPELELGQKYYLPKKSEIKEKTDIKKGKETDIESIVERIVLSEYAPCGVLIDSNMEVVQFRGHTGRFLESAAGKPSLDIFKLAREGLSPPLRAAIYKARKTKHTVKREAEAVLYNGRRMRANITVVPAESGPLKEEFFLVLFDEITRAAASNNLPKARGKISLKGKSVKSNEYIDNLQKELAETKEYLQAVMEEQESANEEVKTANEEILSSNEELQSTNEELETAKEELQSSNEELITANDELQNRNAEVSLLNNDLINLLSSINMPVIMMGTDLVIRRITPQAEKALNIIPSDIGRPISKIKLNVDIPDLEKILLDVIESLHPKTFEIKSREGNWYSAYIRPYRTLDNKIDGVVAIFVDITERKKAQQTIEEARAYAENIVETIREPLIVLSADLKVISANRSFYQTFKVNHKETQGRFIYDLGNRQWDIPALRKLLEEILPKNNTFDNYEIEHDFESIGPKAMLLNARRLETDQMILITIEDITERKRAEEEIKQGNERFQLVCRGTHDAVWDWNLQTNDLWWNENFQTLFGYRAEEIEPGIESWTNRIHPEDLDRVVTGIHAVIDAGKVFWSDQYRVRRKDGSHLEIYDQGYVMRDASGNPVRMIGAMQDITERKRAEEAQRASEARYRLLFESSKDGILILDAETGTIVDVNPFLVEMLGFSHEQFVGKAIWEIGFFKDIASNKNKFMELQRQEYVRYENLPLETADGRQIEVEFVSNVYAVDHKKVIQCNIRDITERKRAEREMEEKQREMIKMKLEFISMVSHELRTPLTVIKEGISLVADESAGEINEEQKEMLGLSKKNVDRLAKLINDVLDFQKLEAGKIKINAQPNDINEIVRGVYETMTLAAKGKGVDFSLELDDRLPKAGFDNDKITQVLTNLVDNAMKFTEKGSIVIKTSKENGMIHVSVSDTGCGIKKKDLSRVFGRFEQLSTGGERKTGGTGLGLAICKGLIERHNGKIWVDSVFGKGSKFTFALPVYSAEGLLKNHINDGIREVSKNGTKMSILLLSISDLDKSKQKLSDKKRDSTLKDIEALLENSVRHSPSRADDAVLKLSGEVFVVLAGCDKESTLRVKERLEQKLDDYLSQQNLNDKVRLLFGCATYPDDANTDEDLIMKAKELHPIVSTALSV